MTRRDIVLFLVITFVWSWGFWSLPVMVHQGVALPPALASYAAAGTPAAWGPLVGALIVAARRGGLAGVWTLLRRGLAFRIGWGWAAVVFLTFPVLVAVSILVAWAMGETIAPTEAMRQPLTIPIAFVVILLTGGPLQEEFGWRGTLLDPMQARYGALGASLVVGTIWALWHIPLFLFPNDAAPYYGRPFWGLFVTTLLISVLFTWIWNHTGRSIFAMLMFHTMFNLSHWVFPSLESDTASLVLFGLQAALVAGVVAVFGARSLRRL